MGITTTINPIDVNNPTKEILAGSGGYSQDSPNSPNPNTTTTTTSSTTTTSTTADPNSHSIVPASGFYGSIWPQKFVIPQGISSANWTNEARGYPQQTFLGASIRSFNMNGGFGDNSSSLTVELVVDEYNLSDDTDYGLGDDVYWSGVTRFQGKRMGDKFVPPIPGSPVFFKFGPNFATVEEAYVKTFDDLYNMQTVPATQIPSSAGGVQLAQFISPSGGFSLADNSYVALEQPSSSSLNQPASYPILNYTMARTGPARGVDHLVFGGILQTFTQSRSPNGNPLYTVQVVDPREILSNVTVILNDYSGPTYGQQNILNIYGFLEYNPTESTKNAISRVLQFPNEIKKLVQKSGSNIGSFKIQGDDRYYKQQPADLSTIKENIENLTNQIAEEKRKVSNYRMNGDFAGATASFAAIINFSNELLTEKRNLVIQENLSKPSFPMTGTGFSRRGPQGIPYYRVRDAVIALMEQQFDLPQEYKDQGFGGKINFRGYNYIVDFGSLPNLPEFYYFDFDQINLLELAMEICDITNKDLYVSLLPVINHPACKFVYDKNNATNTTDKDMIAGIIRIDTIDRSEQPLYGAVKTYIDKLQTNGIYVESQDLGYELSNITTDKFVVGAQEVGTYFFSSNNDRDGLAFRETGSNGVFPNKPAGYQWTLECSLNQQILPYYGKLGNAITIPKGFGAYQQILLDSSNLNAAGVGAYYVATEMELRCALISFDRWKEFLSFYNDTYMDSVEVDDTFDIGVVGKTPAPLDGNPPPPVGISDTYVVSVPRSVFDTYVLPVNDSYYGQDGLPLSPCNPPYGYPLYYKRMTKIGIPEGGLTDLYSRWTTVLTNFAELQGANKEDVKGVLNSQYTRLKQLKETSTLTQFEQEYLNALEDALKNPTPKKINETIALVENNVSGGNKKAFPIMGSMAKKNIQNALKVYNFVRGVAEECLGKKFLVRIPNKVNLSFSNTTTVNDTTQYKITSGPFGFPPRSSKNIPGYEYSDDFRNQVDTARQETDQNKHIFEIFMYSGIDSSQDGFVGGLAVNYNPILEKYESNYIPTNIGGYFSYDLYQNTLGASDLRDIGNNNWNDLPAGVKQLLVPQDPTNFIGEDGRIAPYVRFDHSENLSLEGFGDADYSQQLIVGNAMIPDLSEHLDNTGSQFYKFPSDPTNPSDDNDENQDKKSSTPPPSQVLFVKCSVDESLHMPPKIIKRKVKVHAQEVKDIGRKSLPNKIFVPCSGIQDGTLVPDPSGCYIDSWSYYKAHYVPEPQAGAEVEILDFDRYNPADLYAIPGGTSLNNTTFVNSETNKLDTRFAYALITLPNRVVSTKDARLRDGFYQSVATERFKHLMTMDVVRGLPGFNLPTAPPPKALTSPLKDVLSKAEPNVKVQAWLAMKKAQSAFTFGFPYQINMSSPSPVYPDLVSLPLLAKDRCYGPWISSQLDGQAYLLANIGGRVDFIKDENLSPWNYGGYYLLNEAGRLQAEFSNSLLLFSERGSFTIASIPSGNSLCKQLMMGGPLVTSITVDISDAGCRTTYQMDLYTSSFGKLQKQKQDLISKIGRDRKRLISERNALIRKGLGKNQNRRNFGAEYSAMAAGNMPSFNDVGMGMMNAYTKIVASIDSQTENTWSSVGGGLTNQTSHQVNASIQQDSDLAKATQMMGDQFAVAEKYQNAGGAAISDIWVPASYGYHPEMSYKPFVNENARNDLYTNREQA